ncbi:MAG: hypothetical protein R3275_10740, partial [Saprospiraceae bacterium]|nr:hypothetical protein [Saprospiraceae bacterium]
SPTYRSAQMGQAVEYPAVEVQPEMIQFENMQLGFPNRIVYFKTSDQQIDVKLESITGDSITRSYDILMSRMEVE